MSGRRFSLAQEEQIVAESRQPGCDHAELCRRHGISRRTLYRWRDRSPAAEENLARRSENGEATSADATASSGDAPTGSGTHAAAVGEDAPEAEKVPLPPVEEADPRRPPAVGDAPGAGTAGEPGIGNAAATTSPVGEVQDEPELVQAFWLDQPDAAPEPSIVPRPPPAPDRNSETRPVAVQRRPGWMGGVKRRSRQGREFWKPAGAIALFVVLTALFTYGPCLLVNRLIASLGAFAAYGLLLAGLTPLSAFILSQFFWKQLPGGLKKIRGGDILTAFLFLIAVILCNLGILIVPTLACFAINFLHGLF